ncbi:MAG: hypothetical protein IKG11_02580 [Atopobiaceae bacterium]|nr:hypothetical protein [Atopobiaceae bacterium]
MALNWSKDINFAGLLKRKPRRTKDEYPSKTFMNMVVPDEHERSAVKTGILAALGVIGLLLFAKFGVFDFYARVIQKSNELSERTDVLTDIRSQLGDYNEVLETYRMYEAVRMTSEAGDVAAVDALALVDTYVIPVAKLDSLDLAENVLSLELSGISLDTVGSLVSTLYQQKIVSGVQVSTATDETNANNREKTVSMTISLQSSAASDAADSDAVTSGGTSSGASGTSSGDTSDGVLTEDEKTEIRQEVISNLSGNGQTYTDSATAVAEQNAQKQDAQKKNN